MAVQVTVTFDGNGGGLPSPAAVYVLLPALMYGELAEVTREGYVFAGWWTAAEGGAEVTSASPLAVEADHTLYAHWTPEEAGAGEYFELTDDGRWVYVDAAVVGANLPGGLQAAYDAWLTEEGRYDRLLLIVRGAVADFRTAIAADLDPVGSLDSDLVLLGLLTPVKCAVWYSLALEMGYAAASDYQAGWQDAQVYLRRLLVDLRQGTNLHGTAGTGTPGYDAAGGQAAAPGGDTYSGSSGGGVISLGL